MNYIIIQRELIIDLTDQVNRKIKEGYKPQGGVIFDGRQYTQALITE